MLNNNEKIVNGESYEEIKNIITNILKELDDKSQILKELNITL